MTTSVLITRHDKIGDFVVALPMFQCLKAARPELRLVALVAKINVSLAKELPYIDEVIEYDPDNLGTTLKALKSANCSVSISAFIDSQLGCLLWRAGIRKRIGPATKLAQLWFNQRVKQRRSQVKKTEFAYNLDLLRAFDPEIAIEFQKPLFEFTATACEQALAEFRAEHNLTGLPLIGFHPGSGGSTDGNLTVQDYVGLAKAVLEQGKSQVVFTFGPDDAALIAEVEQELGDQVILYRSKGSVYDFSLLLSNFAVFVSTSTGPMHLAAGSNLHTVSFFGDVKVASPARWASVNHTDHQHNYTITADYSVETCTKIEAELLALISVLSPAA